MIRFLKRYKIFSLLILITIISFLIGIFFYAKLDINSREIVFQNINNLLKSRVEIKDYLIENLIPLIIIWILGISIIGILIVPLIYSYYVFVFAFDLCAMVSYLGVNYLLSIILYLIPTIILLVSLFFLSFYSICFSTYIFRYIFLHKSFTFSNIIKRYYLVLLFTFIGFITSTLVKYLITYITPKIF
ncbi:MAG: hypothetical protein IKH54_02385 [Bacilli bacterium]|nr:hypothetical protein [Bacilli bacterium]MBR6949013.1 hypothetical protein [Bacilli bacterium]